MFEAIAREAGEASRKPEFRFVGCINAAEKEEGG